MFRFSNLLLLLCGTRGQEKGSREDREEGGGSSDGGEDRDSGLTAGCAEPTRAADGLDVELLVRREPSMTPRLGVSALGGLVAHSEIRERLLLLLLFTPSASSGCMQHEQGEEGHDLLVLSSEEIRGTEDKQHFWNCSEGREGDGTVAAGERREVYSSFTITEVAPCLCADWKAQG